MSNPNTLEGLIERAKSKTPCASNYECLVADLMALAPHYIHKDKVREIAELARLLAFDAESHGKAITATNFHEIARKLTALLDKEGE